MCSNCSIFLSSDTLKIDTEDLTQEDKKYQVKHIFKKLKATMCQSSLNDSLKITNSENDGMTAISYSKPIYE